MELFNKTINTLFVCWMDFIVKTLKPLRGRLKPTANTGTIKGLTNFQRPDLSNFLLETTLDWSSRGDARFYRLVSSDESDCLGLNWPCQCQHIAHRSETFRNSSNLHPPRKTGHWIISSLHLQIAVLCRGTMSRFHVTCLIQCLHVFLERFKQFSLENISRKNTTTVMNTDLSRLGFLVTTGVQADWVRCLFCFGAESGDF